MDTPTDAERVDTMKQDIFVRNPRIPTVIRVLKIDNKQTKKGYGTGFAQEYTIRVSSGNLFLLLNKDYSYAKESFNFYDNLPLSA